MGTTLTGHRAGRARATTPRWPCSTSATRAPTASASGDLAPLTTDHSYVQELVNLGEITPAEARMHPHRNIVTRALGIDEDIAVDVLRGRPVDAATATCSAATAWSTSSTTPRSSGVLASTADRRRPPTS